MIVIIISIVFLIAVVFILRQAIRDADESPEITRAYDKIYFNGLEEHSSDAPLSGEIDKHLKSLSLRKKLRKIEEDENTDLSFMG